MHLRRASPSPQQHRRALEETGSQAELTSLRGNGDMASRVAALLLLGVICAGFAAAEIAVDCCLSTTDRFLPLIKIASYTIQEAGRGCDISATVFITKAGKTLCVVHPSERAWVKSHIKLLDKRSRAH
ncbi:C-C motif chemokine 20-like [Xiphias gladius]|uniref:C-C motif chemokine 20-like n=1 Tax=Xiphias gladius TaxID=8245 RepID=UPI001A98AB31|nr:C-C motif chemokine 20-like [Xiphias gladius]